MADRDFVSAFPPLRLELELIREYERAVAEEEARIEMLLLFGMEFDTETD